MTVANCVMSCSACSSRATSKALILLRVCTDPLTLTARRKALRAFTAFRFSRPTASLAPVPLHVSAGSQTQHRRRSYR